MLTLTHKDSSLAKIICSQYRTCTSYTRYYHSESHTEVDHYLSVHGAYFIFHLLRQDKAVQPTHVLKQSLSLYSFYFIYLIKIDRQSNKYFNKFVKFKS
jgi:hypothetical protein